MKNAKWQIAKGPSKKSMDVADGIEIVAAPQGVAIAVETKGRLVGVMLTPTEARQFAETLNGVVDQVEALGVRARPQS